MTEQIKPDERLYSLDALRGFDMLFIMGFSGLVVSVCALFPCGASAWLADQMSHVGWNGLHHHDTIFPLFIFIAGISFPFSLAKQRGRGDDTVSIYLRILKRMAMLVLLGAVYNGLFQLKLSDLRLAGVLLRMGLAWGIAAMLFVAFSTRTRVVIAVVILLGYWALSALVVAPDAPAGADPLSQAGCFAGYVDRCLLPGKLYSGTFDPEGLLSTLPAVVTAMAGNFTGEFIRLPEERISGTRKCSVMFAVGAVMALAAFGWNEVLPVNKKLWSSSFVVAVGAYSLLMFTLFYYIVDVRGYRRWTLFFRVIGLNSITVYMAQRIIDFRKIADFFFGGLADICPEDVGVVVLKTGYVAVCWLFLWFLYKKNTFLKV